MHLCMHMPRVAPHNNQVGELPAGVRSVQLVHPSALPCPACSRVDKAKAVNAMLERKRKRTGGDDEEGGRAEGGAEQPSGRQGSATAAAAQGDSAEARPVKQAKQRQGGEGDQQRQQRQEQRQGEQHQGGRTEGGLKVLRTYGQRRAKADPVTDAAAPTLSSGLLKLIAGKRGKASPSSAEG